MNEITDKSSKREAEIYLSLSHTYTYKRKGQCDHV